MNVTRFLFLKLLEVGGFAQINVGLLGITEDVLNLEKLKNINEKNAWRVLKKATMGKRK